METCFLGVEGGVVGVVERKDLSMERERYFGEGSRDLIKSCASYVETASMRNG